jgi:outer membrane protein OmpA-like peptidoglycan-associated protein
MVASHRRFAAARRRFDRPRRPASAVFAGALFAVLHSVPAGVAAQERFEPYQVRANVALATMVSGDQAGRLGYDQPGLVLGLQVGYALLPWLEPQLGVTASGFASDQRTGGLIAPVGGLLVGTPGRSIRPYIQLDGGAGFTGPIVRPFFRAGLGVDFRIATAFTIGPLLGYGQVVHPNEPGNSTDARFFSFGASLLFRPAQPGAAVPPRRVVTYEHVRVAAPPAPPPPPAEPSEELLVLMEEVLPSRKVELLAPVLFKFDSDELEPVGVAMLHEVARELTRRTEIERIEIQGYADSRGRTEYNQELSERRGRAVRDWLVAHGIDAGRLQVAARGASEFVETDDSEPSHEQNRRVVFRVLQMREP